MGDHPDIPAYTVFLSSFSGGHERGTTLEEIKRSATALENPASVVVEAVDKMEKKHKWSGNGCPSSIA